MTTMKLIGSDGSEHEVKDTPANRSAAKEQGFKVDDGILKTVAEGARGLDEAISNHPAVNYNPLTWVEHAALKGVAAIGGAKPSEELQSEAPTKTTPKDSMVLLGGDGSRHVVRDTEANRKAAAEQGFNVEGRDATEKYDLGQRVENQGARGAARSYLENVGNEFGFGVPKMAMSPEEKKNFEATSEANPTAALLGQGAGIVGNLATPVLGMGGAAARAEKAAVKAMAAIGLEESGNVAVKALVNAGKLGAGGAVYSAPHAAGQAVFEDPAKAGESMAYGIGIGALLGGGGSLLGSFSKYVVPLSAENAANAINSSGLDAGTRTMKALGMERATYNKIEGQQTGNVRKIGNILYDAGINEAGLKQKDMVERVNELRKTSGKTIGDIQEELDKHIADSLSEANASRKFVPSINPDAGLRPARKTEKVFESRLTAEPNADLTPPDVTYPPVIGKWGKNGETLDGKVSLYQSTSPIEKEAAPLFERRVGLTDKAVSNDVTDKGSKAFRINQDSMPAVEAMDNSFNPRTIIEKIQNDMLPKYEGPLFAKQKRHLIKSIEQIIGDVTKEPYRYTSSEELTSFLDTLKPTTLGEGQYIKNRMKTGLDLAKGTQRTDTSQLTYDVYSLVKNELADATDRVATSLGKPELKAAYDKARHQYWASSVAEKDLIPKLYAKETGNRFFSPSDHSTSGIMGISAAVHHGPLGLLAMIPAYAAKRVAESNPFQSHVTDLANKAQQAFRAMSAELVASKIAALDAALSSKTVGAAIRFQQAKEPSPISTIVGGTETDPRKAFATFQERMKPFQTDPSKVQAHIQATAQHISDSGDPDAAFHFASHQMQALEYLQSQMPKAKMNPSLFYNPEYKPSAIELQNFSDVVSAAQDPFFLIRKIENGTLTKAQVQHVKVFFPEISKLITDRITAMGYEHQVKENQPNLPYNVRLRLQRLTGALADPGLAPEKAKALQGLYAAKPQGNKNRQSSGDITNNLATDTQKLLMNK